jgi:hypothetical protein
MMKKIFVLMLVLAMAGMAGAALQISVNGNQNPTVPINLSPSQNASLDIWSDIAMVPGSPGENVYWALVAQTHSATISGGVIMLPNGAPGDYRFELNNDAAGAGIPVATGENGVWGSIATFGLAIPMNTAIFDEILFHCEALDGPTTVTLYQLDGGGGMVGVWDTVTINQIPEPATICLLGLGGLALLRRRK